MGIFLKLYRAVTRWGVAGLVYRMRAAAVDRWFDIRNGVNTCGIIRLNDLTITSRHRDRGNRYEPSRVLALREFFARSRRIITPQTCFVDFGCGKGRALIVASQFGIARVKGVEFAQELCDIARRNCREYRKRRGAGTSFEIIEGDAALYPIDPIDTLFFFFHPFDDLVMSQVLTNIADSIVHHPRRVHFCMHNSTLSEVISKSEAFEHDHTVDIHGYLFQVYRNRG